jgi:hypothetical protein
LRSSATPKGDEMDRKTTRVVLVSVAGALMVALGAIAFASGAPYTATCPADGGTAVLDSNSCSTTGTHVVCKYIHTPDAGPAHSFYVTVQ